MKKEDKKVVIETLTKQVDSYKHLYVSDISGLDAVDTQALRRACFDANIKLVQVKNTLLKKALENATNNYEEIFSVLKGDSAIMLCDTGNGPAKLIKEFRKTKDKPVFKAAFVEECAYVGEDQLESLISIKSKEELIADIIRCRMLFPHYNPDKIPSLVLLRHFLKKNNFYSLVNKQF